MKITLLRNPAASYGCSLLEGETGDVSTSLGEQLVAIGVAVALVSDEPKYLPKKVKGVPKNPEIAKAVQPTIAETKDTDSE